ncbi:MAG TPA: hypothetical protein VFG42_14660 [Baekduia sp.]|uniref:hypothetical protein n=1 Tax=Baekduia sp. TaxID=2600305 RepID=UPI002D77BCFF|nr:hypothetical protein [Baekduia sp.]HET6508029.1 hypothetical protein [Baekduia sp.]
MPHPLLRHLAPAALAGLAVTAAAAPAHAGTTTPPVPVAQNVIEHTVWEGDQSLSPDPGRRGQARTEIWQGSDATRIVYAIDGRLRQETVYRDGRFTTWLAPENRIFGGTLTFPDNNAYSSRATQERTIRAEVAAGHLAPAGETEVSGHAALVLRSTPTATGDRDTRSEVVVDRDTYEPLVRTVRSTDGRVLQTRRLVVSEDLPRTVTSNALLRLADHPGAAVDRSASATRKKTSKATKKASHRRAAARRHAGGHKK